MLIKNTARQKVRQWEDVIKKCSTIKIIESGKWYEIKKYPQIGQFQMLACAQNYAPVTVNSRYELFHRNLFT